MEAEDDKCKKIVALIQKGKTNDAADIIMSLCYDNLCKTLRRAYPNKHTFSDDVIHNAIITGIVTLIQYITKKENFDCVDDNSPCAFIATVARRQLNKHWEKEKKSPLVAHSEKTPDESVEPTENEKIDAEIILTHASPKCKQLITLRIFEDLPFKEIGEKIGITTENAKVQYHKCIKGLRASFNK